MLPSWVGFAPLFPKVEKVEKVEGKKIEFECIDYGFIITHTRLLLMGIKHLNKFIRTHCPDSVKCISACELSGKKIAVDINIYLYKYAGEDQLIENIYLMLAIFRHYGIIPIFIFDGKPPTEKKELLMKRREDKKSAETEYNRLKGVLSGGIIDEDDKQEIVASMDALKRQFIHITKDKLHAVKELMRAYGATYYDAPGEADELCAMLVVKKKVWACLSEDMDMFVYGCTRVLRYFSLLNHTFVCYDTKGILDELGISQKEFTEICIVSGTDYNSANNAATTDKNENTLEKTLKWFKKFHKAKNTSPTIEFYDWLSENTDYIEDLDLLIKIYGMFNLKDNHICLKPFENIRIANGPIMKADMREILINDGFLFLD